MRSHDEDLVTQPVPAPSHRRWGFGLQGVVVPYEWRIDEDEVREELFTGGGCHERQKWDHTRDVFEYLRDYRGTLSFSGDVGVVHNHAKARFLLGVWG
mmetsp:Transcript_8181/g.10262  ORF Transcript_8181/g.10262 Transcript_8181/m.10262 type:complete len:98 (+) Transcript_8181:241-534(+)